MSLTNGQQIKTVKEEKKNNNVLGLQSAKGF